eukprot:jgi/Ulvmu1/1210/UM109_0008.1
MNRSGAPRTRLEGFKFGLYVGVPISLYIFVAYFPEGLDYFVRKLNNGKSNALITGGSGFLGQFLVQHLLSTGRYASVKILDLNPPNPEIPGAEFIKGNLTDVSSVMTACQGIDVVFHTATAAPTAQNAASAQALMHAVNVDGTQNVLDACGAVGVKRLVFTSSASVVFDGSALVSVDESKAYADPPMDLYTHTKAQAEKLVLQSAVEGLQACALRPSAIFGPGDRLTVPSVAKRAQQGKMKYIIGSGENMFDFTYVENVAHAHALADAALATPSSPAAGQAFFINNDEPVLFWGMMGDICEGLGYARPSIRLPVWLMMCVAVVSVWLSRLLGIATDLNPMRIRVCSVERTLSCAKAKRVLGYAPVVDMKTGLQRTLATFEHLRKNTSGDKKAE